MIYARKRGMGCWGGKITMKSILIGLFILKLSLVILVVWMGGQHFCWKPLIGVMKMYMKNRKETKLTSLAENKFVFVRLVRGGGVMFGLATKTHQMLMLI